MSKIGIVTFFEAPNYGGFLQAFALKEFLENKGNEVIFIRHEANKLSYPQKSNEPKKNFKYNLNNKILKVMNYMTISKENYNKKNVKYDVVILGSDEIWNLKNGNYEKIPIFWGRNLSTKKIISYAPSAGGMTFKKLLTYPLNVLSVNRLNAISVRDDHTQELIKKITRKKITRVLDPTFLIEYNNILPKIDMNEYILVYSYKLNEEQKNIIIEYAKKNNKKIIFTGSYCDWADENPSVNPFEWLALIKNSDFVFSTTFHGTVFSLIFRKQFLCLSKSEKISSLLKEFNLLNRIVLNKQEFDKEIENKINYEKVNIIINKRTNESKEFLLKNI